MDTYRFFVIHIGVRCVFPNHLTGVGGRSGTGHEETVVFQVSLLKTSVIVMGYFFKIQPHLLCLSVIYVFIGGVNYKP